MKISRKISSLIIGSIITSTLIICDRSQEKIVRTYRLYNGSSYSMKIEFYLSNILRHSNIITGPGLLSEAKVDNDAGFTLSAENAFLTDSVVVTFDNLKRQVYYFDKYFPLATPETERNILVDSVYTPVHNELYEFTFTEEDYLKADSI